MKSVMGLPDSIYLGHINRELPASRLITGRIHARVNRSASFQTNNFLHPASASSSRESEEIERLFDFLICV
jgi:hypothetical protein